MIVCSRQKFTYLRVDRPMKARVLFLSPGTCLLLLGLLFAPILPTQESAAFDVELEWIASDEQDIAGYRAYLRRDGEAYNYTSPDWEGPGTHCTLRDLDDDTLYHFVVRAVDLSGQESNDSNEESVSLVALTPLPESENPDPPTFQWTPGIFDVYWFYSVFHYPGYGYHYIGFWLTTDFLITPDSWWAEVSAGRPCY